MKKFLLSLCVAMLSVVGAWAQSASFDTSTPGTLKIKASGDLTNYTIHDEVTTTVFTDAAEGNIFTGTTSNTGVTAGDVYNPLTTYYLISDDINFGEALNSGKPADGNDNQYFSVATSKAAKSAYAGYKILNAYYYNGWTISDGEWQIGNLINNNADQGPSRGFYRAVLVSEGIASGTNIGDATDGVINYNGITAIPLSPSNWTDYFEEVTTITPKSGANLYVSINDGEKVGKSSAFLWEDGMSIYNATLGENVLITDNAAYFGETGEGAAFITDRTTPLDTNFKTALATMLNSGSYTTVVFEQNGGAITIDPEIVQMIVTHAGVVTADFGAATASTYESLLGSNNLAESLNYITFPLTQMDDDDMIFPAGVYNNFQYRAQEINVTIPNGYTKIAPYAFTKLTSSGHGISNLVSVTLPNTLVEIGEGAFLTAPKLSLVTYPGYTGDYNCAFPKSLKKIYKEAFSGCEKLVNFDFNSGLEFIGNSAFWLDHIVGGQKPTLDFPASLKYLGPGSFENRNFAEVYFHGDEAPICPVGPYYADNTLIEVDVAAFSAVTHMGNNGFTTAAKSRGGEDTATGYPYANRENYFKSDGKTYFTILHFPAGVTIDQAKTYKDVTRKYETVEDYSTFLYNASHIDCGLESSQDGVMSFKDYNASVTWVSEAPLRKITAGHVDTYLGAQKMWPSQTQWMRAYTTVANGLEWNGVDTYRPDVTDKIELMAEDGLKLWDGTKYVAVGSNDYTYTPESADAYNLAHFSDYWNENTIKDPAVLYTNDEVDDYNFENVEGAIQEGQTLYYTQKEIDDHNATLKDAVKEGDIEIEGHDAIYMTYAQFVEAGGFVYTGGTDSEKEAFYDEAITLIAAGQVAWSSKLSIDPKLSDAQETVKYTAETAAVQNLTLPDAWQYGREKGTATRESAAAYNLTLPGAWQYGREMTPATHYTAEQIAANNANIEGLVHAGDPAAVNVAMADYISKIAYQSTRRFVLADDGSQKGDDYDPEISSGRNWWTLVLPFNMTKAQVREVFGDGVKDPHVCLFSGVDRNATEGETKRITLKFQNDVYAHKTPISAYNNNNGHVTFDKNAAAPGDDDIVIKAFEAYMIYPTKDSKDAAEFKIENPKVEQGSPWPTVIQANTEGDGNTVATWADGSDHTEYRFVGNLNKQVVVDVENEVFQTRTIPQYSYVYAKKSGATNYQFWFYTGNTSAWKVKKCLVQATAKDGGAKENQNFFGGAQAKQVSLFGLDSEDETTEIEDITIVAGEGDDAAIYNISGQRISAPQKGIYIKNGKKYIAR